MANDTTCSYCAKRPAKGTVRADRWIGLGRNAEFSFCSDACRADIEAAAERVRRGTPWFMAFIVLLLGLTVALVILPMTGDLHLVKFAPSVPTFLAGALILGFPLVASNAVRSLGIRQAERLARGTGIVMMLVGVGLLVLLHFLLP